MSFENSSRYNLWNGAGQKLSHQFSLWRQLMSCDQYIHILQVYSFNPKCIPYKKQLYSKSTFKPYGTKVLICVFTKVLVSISWSNLPTISQLCFKTKLKKSRIFLQGIHRWLIFVEQDMFLDLNLSVVPKTPVWSAESFFSNCKMFCFNWL